MKSGNRLIPSPAMIVAVVAFIAALTGSAVALQGKGSVKSNDIANNAVKTKAIANGAVKAAKLGENAVTGVKIKNGAVTSPDIDLFRDGFAAELISTASGPPVDLGGPSVTVTVPEGGLVQIFARVDAQATGGGGDGAAQVHLFEPTFLGDAPRIMNVPTNSGVLPRYTSPGSGDVNGVGAITRGGILTLAPPAGTYTFSLRYSQAGGATASFQNRRLWVGVVN